METEDLVLNRRVVPQCQRLKCNLNNWESTAVPQVLSEERQELHATLDTQDTFVRRASLERQRLCNEAARLNQILQAKDQVIRWVYFYIMV